MIVGWDVCKRTYGVPDGPAVDTRAIHQGFPGAADRRDRVSRSNPVAYGVGLLVRARDFRPFTVQKLQDILSTHLRDLPLGVYRPNLDDVRCFFDYEIARPAALEQLALELPHAGSLHINQSAHYQLSFAEGFGDLVNG